MAGIAFRLQKLLEGESYTDLIRAYLYSAVIAAGPFLMTMATLAIIRFMIFSNLDIADTQLLMGLIVYVFSFSLIGVSPFFYVVTRYLADKYFLEDIDSFTPSYLSVLYVIFFLQSCIGVPYLYFLDVSIEAKLILYCLLLITSGIWIAMAYLSASRNYTWIVWSYLIGSMVSVAFCWQLGLNSGFQGYLYGFTLGQFVCFLILTIRLFREFGYKSFYDFGFFSYFRKHPYLVFIGIFYYGGIWIDKFIFWFTPEHDVIIPLIYVYGDYDTPFFLAFLTIIPSMAFFLVQMETSFVQCYHDYYACIRKRMSLKVILEKKRDMMENLTASFQFYALFQGCISAVIILLIYYIADIFMLNPAQLGIFRICILGCFLMMGMLLVINIQFYFDFQRDACLVTAIFFFTNLIFTLISYKIGFTSYGFGFTLSCFVSAFASIFILNHKLRHLEFWTFMKQPILIPTFKFESENRPLSVEDQKPLPEI